MSAPDLTAGGAAASGGPRFICFLCKRKFKSAPLLTRHKQLSELHRKNLCKQDEEIHQRKDETRAIIGQLRKQMQEVEHAANKGSKSEEELQNQRGQIELKLRQALAEYGQTQEKLEASRQLQWAERTGGGASNHGPPNQRRSEVHETRVGRLVVSAGAAAWQGPKEVQEDRYIMDINLEAIDGQTIVGFACCDGHSGSLCVDHLVEHLPRNLQKCVSTKSAFNEENITAAMTEAIAETEEDFLVKARKMEILDGSTMILCLIFPDADREGGYRLLVANIGDSRAVLCRAAQAQGGRLSAVRLSDDHKPDRDDERKRIEANGGIVDMQGVMRVFTPAPANFGGMSVLWGLAVSRAFGDLLMKEPQNYDCAGATGALVCAIPEVHSYELHPREDRFLVLACDGVWDVLGDDDAVAVCVEHRSADLAAHALIRRAFEIGSEDNITAVVVAWQFADNDAPDSKKARHDD